MPASGRSTRRCRAYDGFDHNAQSLRVVTELERRYALFDGLNLTWETHEGLVKHNGPLIDARGRPVGRTPAADLRMICVPGARIWSSTPLPASKRRPRRSPTTSPTTATISRTAARRPVHLRRLTKSRSRGRVLARSTRPIPASNGPARSTRLIRRIITVMIKDVLAETRRRLAAPGARISADDVRRPGTPSSRFSTSHDQASCDAFKRFLTESVYRHDRVVRVMDGRRDAGRRPLRALSRRPSALPAEWARAARPRGNTCAPRLRLHRRHDRPLRGRRAPAAV